jgi:hypothetical protein
MKTFKDAWVWSSSMPYFLHGDSLTRTTSLAICIPLAECLPAMDEYDNLKPEYSDTVFSGPDPGEGWPESFAIVTAYNPDGVNVDDAANLAANEELEATVRDAGLSYSPMAGGSGDGSHVEPGFLVLCDLETALELGHRFNQEAVFWIEAGRLHLVACSGGARVELGAWQDRIRLAQE